MFSEMVRLKFSTSSELDASDFQRMLLMVVCITDQTAHVTMLPTSLPFPALFLAILLVLKIGISREKACKSLYYVYTLIPIYIIDLLDYFRHQNMFNGLKSFVVALAVCSVFSFLRKIICHTETRNSFINDQSYSDLLI